MNKGTIEWSEVKGYEGHYVVSNCGHVASLKWNRKKILRHMIDLNNFHFVTLSKNGNLQRAFISQLVITHFKGPRPEGKIIEHLDRNKANDHVSNLRWTTRKGLTYKKKKIYK